MKNDTPMARLSELSKPCRPLLIATIAASGTFHFLSPVLADGTAANTPIVNRATATYSDGTTDFDAISNTVTITVAEVRGLTVTSAGATDPNGGSITTGDDLYFDYVITNTGNEDAYVFIPGVTELNNLAAGGTVTRVDIIEVNGTDLSASPINVSNTGSPAGASTQTLADPTNFPDGDLPADTNIVVRVTVSVTATNAGDTVSVQFGDTSDNTPNTQNQQNIEFSTDDGVTSANDIYTIDTDGATPPANGEREAAAYHEEFVATAVRPLAQATVFMVSSTDAGANPNDATDDTITYNLDLEVENNPQPGYPAGSLEGTTINLDGTPTERILVSAIVPPNTEWDGIAPTAPTGWTPVYSIQGTGAGDPTTVAWTTTTPTDPGDIAAVERIGFIYDATTAGDELVPGTTVNDFEFTVVTSGLPITGGTVANIAQLFGETFNDPTDEIVYDESGDQDPNNYDDGVFPVNPEISGFTGQTGEAFPSDPDTNNNNTGTGPDGESNVVTISALPLTGDGLLNGPNGVPNATGPTNSNDDFTNAGADVASGEVGAIGDPSDPAAVTITNTVANTVATDLDTVTLLPIAPDDAYTVNGNTGVYGVDRDTDGNLNDEIPDNTTVTITFGGQTAIYNYSGGTFTLDGASPNPVVVIGTLNPSQQQSYTVEINLPPNTGQIQGYTIPILAFVDNNGSGDFDQASETVFNFTNNRVYPGFVSLVKDARILDSTGNQRFPAASGTFTDTFTDPSARPQPGEFIEYRIRYNNISEAQPPSGAGNVVLTATELTIVEDGDDGTNTWATFTTHQQDTFGETGTSLEFFDGSNLTLGTSDPAAGTEVRTYNNTIPSLAPQTGGAFTFRRVVD
jgi:hypothetical protein